jgi:amidophosphoribosyltransferase
MGGFFGVVSKQNCVSDLFYGTDYHSHLGTRRGGLVVKNPQGFIRFIHKIENDQFRSKFEQDIVKMKGNKGIGVISDYEDQPLLICSHLGKYALVTVSAIKNEEELVRNVFSRRAIHFSEMREGVINPTELIAALINEAPTFEDGIENVMESIKGSCSLLLLTDKGVYAGRDRLGRTPVALGEKEGSFAATLETCAFPNLGFSIKKYLGPGEIVFITEEGIEQRKPARDKLQICGFLWVYYGYPASSYENINVETVRNRCGALLARNDDVKVDMVAGIPDSGTGHGLGYASEARIPFKRPFVKYTPTWPRSFTPYEQETRDLVAKMKLIPIREIIEGKRLLFCEDSIVRGTQLKDTIQRLYDFGAMEVHMRPACPPLTHGCKFLNFTRSKSELDLAARKAIHELEGEDAKNLDEYSRAGTEKYEAMVDKIRQTLRLTTLKYQRLENLVKAIGLPKEKLCTYCWDGVEIK